MSIKSFLESKRQQQAQPGIEQPPNPMMEIEQPTYESPISDGKNTDLPLPEDGGGGVLDAPIISGGLGIERGLEDPGSPPNPGDGIWAGSGGEQAGGDDTQVLIDPGSPANPMDPTGDVPAPPVTPTTPTPNPNDLGPSIAARLKEIFGQGLSPTAKDAGLQGAINASRVSGQRNLERERALLAERASIDGTTDSGGFNTQLLGLTQDQGERDRAFEGNLLANAGTDRRNQIMQALQLASGNQNANNNLGLSYAQLLALLNSQALSAELNGV